MLAMGSSQSLSSTSSRAALSDDKEVGIVKMLSELQTTKEVRGLWFYGKINAILNATGWAYMGCFKRSCRARVIKYDNEFECTKCGVRSSEENWLYKLKLNVVHGRHKAELLFWDQACKQFLGKPASDFREHLDDDKGHCTKHFPKKFSQRTTIDKSGYPKYRRRNNGRSVEKNGHPMDNRYVIPHNRTLLLKYGGHINVEWCNQSRSVKYLFKYINKGDDRITVAFSEATDSSKPQKIDEIKMYYDCRYISACEAAWRIFSYHIHYRDVPVERLSFHLPGEQNVYYKPDASIESVLRNTNLHSTKFIAWMRANQLYQEARELTYVDFPSKFTWSKKKREWSPRKRGFAVGRVFFVRPGAGEKYYLRVLLNVVKGPRSFEELRTVDGKIYDTFRDACYARGLHGDDKEYIDGITESSHSAMARWLRHLFVTLLLQGSMTKPESVWEKCWEYLSEDILYNVRKNLHDQELELDKGEIQKYCLVEIEKLLQQRGKSLRDYVGMPVPPDSYIPSMEDILIHEELKYDKCVMAEEHQKLLKDMTDEQRAVYEIIMESVDRKCGGVFFLYGHGGTGKTYLWRTLSAAIRSRGEIVLNVASSGIASLLLPGGRTAHSRFAIPLNVTEDSTCNIKHGSPLARLLEQT
ncbi:unnamed protein product [Cuscuta epithymum]|uniref:ATP-dependent DNA helicase n=1 Tax=Cuscuta epithymum TaxID=186058 RepID=A0AAV0DLE8_9ASTE|nr:unnamed protein product [Cuscuta epithymum]